MRRLNVFSLLFLTALSVGVRGQDARRILAEAGLKGGLVVHVGCGDGALTVGLRANDGTVVHGLDTDPNKVAQARETVRTAGLAGAVTIAGLSGKRLPLIDNLVNLLVVSDPFGVGREEMLRVLAPNGVLVVCAGGKLERTVKPRPTDIDEWTHYLHDAGNNAVARDTVVGPPRHMQWLGAPLWTRNHHKLNSVSSVVTANGRLFYVVDQATSANMAVPGKWSLVVRDAFNGVKLWSKPIGSWTVHTVRFRSGPPQVTRLLVAEEDRVFAPLGLSEPVSVIDAVTGKTLATYPETKGAEEMVLAGRSLLVLTGEPIAEHAVGHPAFRDALRLPNRKSVVAINTIDGRMLWQWTPSAGSVRAETLGADDRRVYVQVDEAVVCLELANGNELWSYGQRATAVLDGKPPERKRASLRAIYGKHALVVSDGVVLCKLGKRLVAISADTGRKLWDCECGGGFHAPPDIFVIDGLVWQGSHPGDSVAPPPVDDFSEARDLHTGEVRKRNQTGVDIQTAGHHHRCYREKATTRYIITGKRGVEMMDLVAGNHSRANWVRGTCQYGMLPANGLVYTPPHSCGCYMESKLYGFWALSADQPAVRAERALAADIARLSRGPAYGASLGPGEGPEAWPQLRNDVLRSGIAGTTAPTMLKQTWTTTLGGKLTQPVAAGGRVVVASVDAGVVYALDAATGRPVWHRAVGGRVDSAPTIHRGLVLFGCADGWVYCLRLTDGELVWRFLAAPADMRTVALNQIESLWPVRGSVLVLNGIAYCSAGRSTWIDGGMDLYGLDPVTGKVVCQARYESTHPTIGEGKDRAEDKHNKRVSQNTSDYKTFLQPDRSDAFSMAGGTTSDVLVSDGTNVFLRQVKFDAQLRRREGMTRHLFSTSSLLDDTENHRSHWVLGTGDFSMVPVAYSWIANGGGKSRWKQGMAVPRGLLMIYTDESLWIVRRKGGRYSLFEMPNTPFSATEKPLPDFREVAKGKAAPVKWEQRLNARPRAKIKSGEHLFLATSPIVIPKDDPNAAYEGRMGGMIWIAAAKDGAKIAEYELPAPAVWDGLAAANKRIYAALVDGSIVCLGSEGEKLPEGDTPAAPTTRPKPPGAAKLLPKGSGGPAAPGKAVTPDSSGKLVLKPETAKTSGGLVYQRDRNNLGAWTRPQASCQWTLKGVKKATYHVEFSYGSTNPGKEYTITAANAKLVGRTVHTGGIKTYKPHDVGTIDLPAGKVVLSIKGEQLKGALMNFRLLTLTVVR